MTRDEAASTGTESTHKAPRRLLLRALLATLLVAGVLVLAGIAWFTFTEPERPNMVPATPTAIITADEQSLGFRGDSRSPSQIIRAARRAQELASSTPDVTP